MLNIKIIIGSTRQKRFSDKPAAWIFELAKSKPDVSVELLDLRDYPLPFFDEPISPAYRTEPYTNPVVVKWVSKIQEADAFIIVTPEYNHGYTGVLKNAMDYPYPQWNNKPVAFVAHGGVGGGRVVEQLREVAVELQMAPIKNGVFIPAPWTMLDEKGELKAGALDGFKPNAEHMLTQMLWWANALKAARQA